MTYRESCITNINKSLLKMRWICFFDQKLKLIHHTQIISWGLFNLLVDIDANPKHVAIYDHEDPDQLDIIRVFCYLHLFTYSSDDSYVKATPLGMNFIKHALDPKPHLKNIRYVSCVNVLDPKSFRLSRTVRNTHKCFHLLCSIVKYLHPDLTHIDMVTMYKMLNKFYATRRSFNYNFDDNLLLYPTLNSFNSYLENTSIDNMLPIGVRSRLDLLKSVIHNITIEYGALLDNQKGFIMYYSNNPKLMHIYKSYFKSYYRTYTFNSIRNITELDLIKYIIRHYKTNNNYTLNDATLTYLKENFGVILQTYDNYF